MKKKLLKSFLLAAGLLVGSNVWATTTLTYDFASYASNGYTSGYKETYRVDAGYKPYYFTDITDAGGNVVMKLNKRFLGTFNGNNWQFSGGALKAVKGSPDFCVNQLAIGDKVTITFTGTLTYNSSKGSSVSGATIYVDGDDSQTEITDGTALVSGTTYVVKTTPHATLMMTGAYNDNNNPTLISSVVIVPTVDETIGSNPTITLAGVNGTKRTVRIQAGLTNKWYSPTTTYYTTDGSEPTTSTETKFTGYGYKDIEIEANTTFKALSVATTNSEVTASASETIEAGTAVQLATPTITRTSDTEVTITSDQTAVTGAPTATIHYTYGDEDDTFEGTSKVLTISADATVTAYATATGYTDSEAAEALAVAPYPLIVIESSAWGGTSGTLDTDNGIAGNKTTYYPLLVNSVKWGDNIYFQPKDSQKGGWNFDSSKWYNNSAGSAYCWMMIQNLQAGDVVVVAISEAAAATYNATYSAKYSYSGHYAYVAGADGNVELRFARTSSKGNNILTGVYVYRGKITATLGTNGYATFASIYPLDLTNLPDGLTAYKAAIDAEHNKVLFTSVTEAVQANTGLLLKGNASTEYDVPVVASGSDILASNALLVNTGGNTFTAKSGYTYYGMIKDSNPLTFGTFDPSTVAIPANKAYLEVSTTTSSRLIASFDDDATAVFDLNDKSEMTNDKWYDLQGRRIDGSRLNPGIYIVNGRKVVVK